MNRVRLIGRETGQRGANRTHKKTPPKRGFEWGQKAISPAAETEPAVEPG